MNCGWIELENFEEQNSIKKAVNGVIACDLSASFPNSTAVGFKMEERWLDHGRRCLKVLLESLILPVSAQVGT